MASRIAHSRPALVGSIAAIACLVIFNVGYWIVWPTVNQPTPVTPDSYDPSLADGATSSSSIHLVWALLIIVAAIVVGVLCWLLLSRLQAKQKVQRNQRRHDDLAHIQQGLQAYFEATGHYPVGNNDAQRQVPATDVGTGWEQFGFPAKEEMQKYLRNWPVIDPQVGAEDRNQGNQYLYYPMSGGQAYALYAHLEPQKAESLPNYNQADNLPTAWGDYNLKVTSSNVAPTQPLTAPTIPAAQADAAATPINTNPQNS